MRPNEPLRGNANLRTLQSQDPSSPSLVESSVHYAWVVGLFVVLGIVGAFVYANRAAPVWRATASLVVEDPQADVVFDELQSAPSKTYVANQVEIIRSTPIATRAVSIISESVPEAEIDPDDIMAALNVPPPADSDKILVIFDAEDAQTPVLVVNAIGTAYQEFSQAEARSDFDAAIASVDALINEVQLELTALDDELAGFEGVEPQILRRIGELTDLLVGLGPDAIEAAVATETEDGEAVEDEDRERAIANLETQITAVRDELSAFQTITALSADQFRLEQVASDRIEAAQRFAELQRRRDQLRIDAELIGSGVTLFDPALEASRENITRSRLIIVGAGLGLAMGVFGAYLAAVVAATRTRRAAGVAE